jgi:hypothetical protein
MKSYIKEEFRRGLISKTTFATVIVSIMLVFGGMIEYFGWIKSGNLSVLYLFLQGYNSGTASFLIMVFPIIACLPFAASYISDRKSGLNKYIYIRMDKGKYRLIRFLVNGIVGGSVLLIGPLVAFIFLMIVKIFTGIPLVSGQMETVEFFRDIGVNSPILMIIIILITLFFCGFVFASFAIGVSTFIQNIYLIVLIPFIYLIISATVLTNIHGYLNAMALYDVNYHGMGFTLRIVYGIVLCVIGAVFFFIGGPKLEEKNM